MTGKVHVDGMPAEGVYVVFKPVGGPDGGSARSGSDGSYSLEVGKPGEAEITAFWPKVTVKGDDTIEEGDLFKGIYRNPARPVTKVAIHEGENVVPTIELTRPPSDKAKARNR